MTPHEISAAMAALRSRVGIKADVYVSVNARKKEPLDLVIYPFGLVGSSSNDARLSVDADEWQGLFDKANTVWDAYRDRHRDETTKKMALAIIRITDELGECTDAALRNTNFSDADISSLGDLACERAAGMASRAPFRIKRGAKGNGAPSIVAAE